MNGKTQAAAAAASSMSLRTAREWDTGPVPTATKQPRDWRTRPDPFAAVWPTDVEPLLRSDRKGVLEAKVVLEVLRQRYPEQFQPGQARTLQRRFRDWRARHGVEPEVFFQQVAVPGREAAIDFTHATDLGVTIAGEPLPHLLFEFVLSYSHWTWVAVAFGETFEALVAGVQGALWALGGVPAVLRSDNLSAATHELKASSGRDLTPRFRAVLEHYGMRSSRITPGRAHENGVAEQAHRRLKVAGRAGAARARPCGLRRPRRRTRPSCRRSSRTGATGRRRRASPRSGRRCAPLPSAAIPSYTIYYPVVRRWSTIRVAHRTYSVPAQIDGPHGRSARASECRRGPLPRAARADDAASARRGRAPHRLPACDRLVGAEARRVCAVPLSRGPVSVASRSAARTMPWCGPTASAPTSSTCGSCSWPRRPASARVSDGPRAAARSASAASTT